jgi:glycogen synthase
MRGHLLIVEPQRLERYDRVYEALIEHYGGRRVVRRPSGAALSRLFTESALFVMPSLFEPFGIAPLR